MSNLVFAIPSKGRLKEQCEAWLADCGLALTQEGGERGYRGIIKSAPGVEVRLLSAQEIANGLLSGELHAGVTGEDLLREGAGDFNAQVLSVKALGFGRADVVVAAPQSWIDVDDMTDLEALSHDYPERYGRRMRAATKYMNLARRFFAEHNMSGCRVVESLSATEGAPAAGAADIIVDITTTGSTLAANKLKILSGGTILKSQAQLAASLAANWSGEARASFERILDIVQARSRGKALAMLRFSNPALEVDAKFLARFAAYPAAQAKDGKQKSESAERLFYCPRENAADAALHLQLAGAGAVAVLNADYVFEAPNPLRTAFESALVKS
ncbi:MAG: ATP phosphoribosyltransferase [Caulobacterales bacterium]